MEFRITQSRQCHKILRVNHYIDSQPLGCTVCFTYHTSPEGLSFLGWGEYFTEIIQPLHSGPDWHIFTVSHSARSHTILIHRGMVMSWIKA